MTFKKYVFAALFTTGLIAAIPVAHAADKYPEQTVRIIVPFPPGGGSDTMARFLGNTLKEQSGWDVVVENRPGAGGTVGLGMFARTAPNGYTLALGETANLSINPYLYSSTSYDVARDFTPVISISSQPMILVTRADTPYKNIKQLIEFGKANPGKLTVGNAGTGTVGDITGRFFAKETGIELLHVPYKGAAPAMNDLLGGRVDIFFASSPASIPHVNNPQVRMLAITTLEPAPKFPGVPPLAESIPQFEAAARLGILVPAGTPAAIVDKINTKINEALKQPELREKIMAQGNVVLGGSPKDFSDRISQDSNKWSKIIKEANLRIE